MEQTKFCDWRAKSRSSLHIVRRSRYPSVHHVHADRIGLTWDGKKNRIHIHTDNIYVIQSIASKSYPVEEG